MIAIQVSNKDLYDNFDKYFKIIYYQYQFDFSNEEFI